MWFLVYIARGIVDANFKVARKYVGSLRLDAGQAGPGALRC